MKTGLHLGGLLMPGVWVFVALVLIALAAAALGLSMG